jgi:hypothetical protein
MIKIWEYSDLYLLILAALCPGGPMWQLCVGVMPSMMVFCEGSKRGLIGLPHVRILINVILLFVFTVFQELNLVLCCGRALRQAFWSSKIRVHFVACCSDGVNSCVPRHKVYRRRNTELPVSSVKGS